eukprot:scaffold4265_cov105-Isochrysis_galbana.AAC.6
MDAGLSLAAMRCSASALKRRCSSATSSSCAPALRVLACCRSILPARQNGKTSHPSKGEVGRYARIFLGTARRRGDGRGGALAARLERVRHAVSFTTGLEP